jgi:hypothetical protein
VVKTGCGLHATSSFSPTCAEDPHPAAVCAHLHSLTPLTTHPHTTRHTPSHHSPHTLTPLTTHPHTTRPHHTPLATHHAHHTTHPHTTHHSPTHHTPHTTPTHYLPHYLPTPHTTRHTHSTLLTMYSSHQPQNPPLLCVLYLELIVVFVLINKYLVDRYHGNRTLYFCGSGTKKKITVLDQNKRYNYTNLFFFFLIPFYKPNSSSLLCRLLGFQRLWLSLL